MFRSVCIIPGIDTGAPERTGSSNPRIAEAFEQASKTQANDDERESQRANKATRFPLQLAQGPHLGMIHIKDSDLARSNLTEERLFV